MKGEKNEGFEGGQRTKGVVGPGGTMFEIGARYLECNAGVDSREWSFGKTSVDSGDIG